MNKKVRIIIFIVALIVCLLPLSLLIAGVGKVGETKYWIQVHLDGESQQWRISDFLYYHKGQEEDRGYGKLYAKFDRVSDLEKVTLEFYDNEAAKSPFLIVNPDIKGFKEEGFVRLGAGGGISITNEERFNGTIFTKISWEIDEIAYTDHFYLKVDTEVTKPSLVLK
ncbi:hypothetical protein DFQ01_1081 [Paenibacillus cellulosilyticus]|uniref:Uncharacterized protein n=1 Tax=Paenibacillus cellulosilyticus TaxID=375489 RepID=A0A2V2YTB7_9BACL|nr:hypothetical protein [Paenibacillus cellulosilyticus]PWW02728.1 hypothetical protein DFQ01_1081 [Paenibacillus cellulosilyticus]QKS45656.1 hypothetical protein HUB94_15350 [Paenibacillus cellulosilyticus]